MKLNSLVQNWPKMKRRCQTVAYRGSRIINKLKTQETSQSSVGFRLYTDVGGQHCPCPVLVSFLSWFSVKSCPVSVCPDSVCVGSVSCLDSVLCPDSVRIIEKKLPVVCLSGRTRTRQSCPDFHCPCPPTSELNHKSWKCRRTRWSHKSLHLLMKFVLDIFEIKMDTMIFMRLFLHPTKKNYFKVKYFKGSPDPSHFWNQCRKGADPT